MFQAVHRVNGKILWANLHLLFWLSLFPFVTNWAGENHQAPLPIALYGVVLLMAGVAYYVLSRSLISHHGPDSALGAAVGGDFKGKASLVIYAVAIPLTGVGWWLAFALYILVALIWFIPDRRIEKALANKGE